MTNNLPDVTTFEPSGFFCLRAPTLPFDLFANWARDIGSVHACAGEDRYLDQALDADIQRLRSYLREQVTTAIVEEAIFVASPSLHGRLGDWLDDPEAPEGQKVERSLTKYFTRMTTRSTPFGLFAGCGVGEIATGTAIEFGPVLKHRRRTRLDMGYLDDLGQRLGADCDLRTQVRFFVNSSLYQAAGQYRYVEARMRSGRRRFQLVAVTQTDHLTAIIEKAKSGATMESLIRYLTRRYRDVDAEEASAFVNTLVDSQILEAPELLPLVTGDEATQRLIASLRRPERTRPIAVALQSAHELLAGMDDVGLGNPVRGYLDAAVALKSLPAEAVLSRLFQVDLVKPVKRAHLSDEVMHEIVGGIEFLHRTFGTSEHPLASFTDEFVRRYEDKAVPLVEVLDEECGIGFQRASDPGVETAPLLEGLPSPGRANESASRRDGSSSARERFLIQKVVDCAAQESPVVTLSEVDASKLSSDPRASLPDAISMSAGNALDARTQLQRVQIATTPQPLPNRENTAGTLATASYSSIAST